MALPPFIFAKDKRAEFLGCPLDLFTMDETKDLIVEAMSTRKRLQHVVVNVAKLVGMQSNPDLARDVKGSDLINIDGAGVVHGARMMGLDVPERVSGIDLMILLLSICQEQQFRPYFFGAKQEVLERFIAKTRAQYPDLKIAGWRNGYFSKDEEPLIAEDIKRSQADCLFIAISSPVKENFLHQYRDQMNIPFLMGVGGSIDVLAGVVTRAPVWMQNASLEWLYRLIQEPRRMWRRYLSSNSRYAVMLMGALLQKARKKRQGSNSRSAL